MATVRDCGFELVDHPPYSPDLAPSIFCSPSWKTLGWEAVTDRWRGHICSWGLFRGSGWELLYHGNPSAATPMEEVCGSQGRLCWNIFKNCQIRQFIAVRLWTFQHTLEYHFPPFCCKHARVTYVLLGRKLNGSLGYNKRPVLGINKKYDHEAHGHHLTKI